jgi:hypothetical protein
MSAELTLVPTVAPARTCKRCGGPKEVREHRSGKRAGKVLWRCRSCRNAYQRERQANVPEVRRAYLNAYRASDAGKRMLLGGELRKSYGITVDDYDRMLVAQNGVCAVCRRHETVRRNNTLRRLSVDHDHETGRVRGLLCSKCNRGMGYYEDDPARLRAAADYLEKS